MVLSGLRQDREVNRWTGLIEGVVPLREGTFVKGLAGRCPGRVTRRTSPQTDVSRPPGPVVVETRTGDSVRPTRTSGPTSRDSCPDLTGSYVRGEVTPRHDK